MEKIKVILDTDIGSDIDDSVCLAYGDAKLGALGDDLACEDVFLGDLRNENFLIPISVVIVDNVDKSVGCDGEVGI